MVSPLVRVPPAVLEFFKQKGLDNEEGFSFALEAMKTFERDKEILVQLIDIKNTLDTKTSQPGPVIAKMESTPGLSRSQLQLILEENNTLLSLQVLDTLLRNIHFEGKVYATKGPIDTRLYPKISHEKAEQIRKLLTPDPGAKE